MKHLRLFENYKSDDQIHEICEEYNIKNYTINKDGTIDVNGNVNLKYKGLTELPLIFNKVNGFFNCSYNKLTTLKGSPRIVNDNFVCSENNLTNLIGGPDEIGGWYLCQNNEQLTSLEGIAKINRFLDVRNCNLIDFRGIPEDFYVKEIIFFHFNPVYDNLKEFLRKYDINITNISNKYLELILEINELDAIQDGKIVDIRMDEVLYNIGLI